MLLFGGTGLIGTRIQELLLEKYNIIAPNRMELDLMNKRAIKSFIGNRKFHVIVYAAGVTKQDVAERKHEIADKLNSLAVGWIANIARLTSTPVVYFSTDAVFKGDKDDSPYRETDKVEPVNYYGISKARGENLVLSTSNNNLVLRLSSVFTGKYERKIDLARKIVEKLSKREECFGIIDQFMTLTFSDDAAFGLLSAIKKNIKGILHLSSTDSISNYNFARLIAIKFNYDENLVIPCKMDEVVKDGGKRSKDGWLDTTKAQKVLGKNILHSNTQNISKFFLQYDRK